MVGLSSCGGGGGSTPTTNNNSDSTLQTQTIAFNPSTINKLTTDNNFTIALSNAGSGSGTVSFSSSNNSVASINGNIVIISSAGQTTITATKAADNVYSQASAQLTLIVSKASQNNLNFASTTINKIVSDAPFTNHLTGGSGSGAINYTTSGNNTAVTINNSTITIVTVGTIVITAIKASDDNYLATSASFTLIITSIGQSQAILGPLSGATVIAYRLSDLTIPIETLQTTTGTNLITTGRFVLTLPNVADDDWILVKVSGGQDIDANDDGVLDGNPTVNTGDVHSIAQAKDWREGGANVNVLSEIAFRQVERVLSSASSSTLAGHFDNMAEYLINDLDSDGSITYKDIVKFSPLNAEYKRKLNFGYSSFLQNIKQKVHL